VCVWIRAVVETENMANFVNCYAQDIGRWNRSDRLPRVGLVVLHFASGPDAYASGLRFGGWRTVRWIGAVDLNVPEAQLRRAIVGHFDEVDRDGVRPQLKCFLDRP